MEGRVEDRVDFGRVGVLREEGGALIGRVGFEVENEGRVVEIFEAADVALGPVGRPRLSIPETAPTAPLTQPRRLAAGSKLWRVTTFDLTSGEGLDDLGILGDGAGTLNPVVCST
mmetsp:Transcript_257/g.444  ORF Transcript_257/g.444 Transcript_257/m.444 type:complete len:115 (-) Transcript_257:2137-2481(-)